MSFPRLWLLLGGAALAFGLVALLYLAAPDAFLLGVRIAPGLPFRIVQVGSSTTPTLYASELNRIEWDTRPENIAVYPGENVALCPTSGPPRLNKDCIILSYYTPNKGAASVYVPPYVAPGTWHLVLTGWDRSDQIIPAAVTSSPVQVTVRPGTATLSLSPTPSLIGPPIPVPTASPTPSPQPSVPPNPIPPAPSPIVPRTTPPTVASGTQCLWQYIDDTPPPQLFAFEPRSAPLADYIQPANFHGGVALFQLTALPDDFASAINGALVATPRNRPVWFRLLTQDREPIVPYRIPRADDANYNYVINQINQGKAGPATIGRNMNVGAHVLSVHGSPTGGTFRLIVQDRYGTGQTAPITYVAGDAEQTRTNIQQALDQLIRSRPPQQIVPTVTVRSATEFELELRSTYFSYGTIPVDDRFSLGIVPTPALQGGTTPYLEISNPDTETAWKQLLLSVKIEHSGDFLEAVELRLSYHKKRGGTGFVVLKPVADVSTDGWRGLPAAACPG